MVEDATVNTGAVVWPTAEVAADAVRRMQLKLHRWARGDSSRRFGDLYNLVYDPAFLVDAFERVARNKGSKTSGVDGWTVAHIRSQIGVEEFLSNIGEQLKGGTGVGDGRVPAQVLACPTAPSGRGQAAVSSWAPTRRPASRSSGRYAPTARRRPGERLSGPARERRTRSVVPHRADVVPEPALRRG